MNATDKPDDGPLVVARFLTIWAGLMSLIWLGALLERTGWAELGGLIWYASGCLLSALGFMLFYWGSRSATRRAAKDEEVNR